MWPTDVDYFEAVQSPKTRFADPELQQAEAVTNRIGLPVSCSGNFAVVFRLRSRQGQEWAVKCFTRPVANLQQRYAAIAEHLQSRSLSCMVPFEYLERGIRVRNEWYPVVKMEWVEGQTCREFVAERLEKGTGLRSLMYLLWYLSQQLVVNDIAHGDIQHGNLIILEGVGGGRGGVMGYDMRLVDYDGLWVPAVGGIPSGEYGHRHYQHPQRRGYYGPAMDHFPLLVLYTGLYALAVSGDREGLWQRYDQGDNILFTEGDFQEPGKSGLLRELWGSGEERLRRLVGHMVLGLRGRVDQVRPLGELAQYDGFELEEVAGLESWQEGKVVRLLGGGGGVVGGFSGAGVSGSGVSGAGAVSPASVPAGPVVGVSGGGGGSAVGGVLGPVGGSGVGASAGSMSGMPGTGGSSAPMGAPSPAYTAAGYAPPVSGPSQRGAWEKFIEGVVTVLKCISLYFILLRYYINSLLCSIKMFIYTFLYEDFSRSSNIIVILWGFFNGLFMYYIIFGGLLYLFINTFLWILGYGFGNYTEFCMLGLPTLLLVLFLILLVLHWFVIYWRSALRTAEALEQQPAWMGGVKLARIKIDEPDGYLTQLLWEAVEVAEDQYGRAWERARPYIKPTVWAALGTVVTGYVALLVAGVWLFWLSGPMLARTLEGHKGGVSGVAVSGDGRVVVSGGEDGVVCVWDGGSGQLRHRLAGHKGWVWGVAVSGDGRVVVSGGEDGVVCVWDGVSGQLRHRLAGHKGGVRCVAVSGDGRVVVSGGWYGEVCVWDGGSGQLRHRLAGHKDAVSGVAVSGDGGVVVSGDWDGVVYVWDGGSGQLRHRLAGHKGGVYGVAVSGDGRVVVSGGWDGVVCVWDGVSGQLRHRLAGHKGGVWCVAVSGDGRVVVSGGEDGVVCVWDGVSGQLRHRLAGHKGEVLGVAVSGDGGVVVSGGGDGMVRVWKLPR